MRTAKAKPASNDALRKGIRAIAPVFATAIVFSFFINLLLFVSPLYMLQIYDRVSGTRNLVTLGGLDHRRRPSVGLGRARTLRSCILVRAGLLFDERFAAPMYGVVHRGLLRQPDTINTQYLRDVDVIREFCTGAGLIAFCDLPWFPSVRRRRIHHVPMVRLYSHLWRGRHAGPRASQRVLDPKTLLEASKANMMAEAVRRSLFETPKSFTRWECLRPWSDVGASITAKFWGCKPKRATEPELSLPLLNFSACSCNRRSLN